MSETSKSLETSEQKRNQSFADLAAAAGITLLGVLLAAGSSRIPPGVGYDRIGPRFFPSLVAGGLVLLGMWLAVAALRTSPRHEGRAVATDDLSEESVPTNWRALGFLGAGLVLCLALFERGGFVIASSLLFWVAALSFGSRKPWRDAVIAVIVAVVVFVAFTRGLGLTLPGGILGGLL